MSIEPVQNQAPGSRAASTLDDAQLADESPLRRVGIVPYTEDSGIMVLGVPIHPQGSTIFVKDSLESALAKQQIALDRLASFPDAQIQHCLLRHCLDAVKVQWLLRTSPCLAHPDVIQHGDSQIRGTLSRILGQPLNDSQWLQATMSLRDGGLGIRTPSLVAGPARISCVLNWCERADMALTYKSGSPSNIVDNNQLLALLTSQIGTAVEPLGKWSTERQISPFTGDSCQQSW